ncbi:methyl-accepting chemotaxis protein [Salipaludibacillus daqingensis]|uniref:methyl-accepting chemotaxis protein n=1 Tax=Salipaludibacillus daqingensis TaxID=3041001 RepID=UPI002473AD3D|nr:methyl-accepting chemotaxis protein [Salipaludibacillus daqingensis]
MGLKKFNIKLPHLSLFKGKKKEQRKTIVKQEGKRQLSLKYKLLLSFILLSVIPSIIIATLVYSVSKNTLEEKVSEMSEDVGFQISENINHTIEQIEDITMRPFSDQSFYQELTQDFDELDGGEEFQTKREIADFFSSIANSTSHLEHFFYQRTDGEVLGRTSVGMNVDEIINPEVEAFIQERNIAWVAGLDESSDYIYVFRNGIDGTVVLQIESSLFDEVFRVDEDIAEKEIYIIDSTNHVVASSMSEEVGSEYVLNNENEQSIMSSHMTSNDWQVVISTPKSALMQEMNDMIQYVVILVVIFALVASLIGVFITFTITKPVDKIVHLMKKAEQGDLTVRTEEIGNNEIGQLGSSFNNMLLNIKDIILENQKMSTSAVKSAEQLKTISIQSSQTADQIAGSIEDVANGAMEQVDYSEKTTTEMQGLSYEIADVEKNVDDVSRAATNTKKSSQHSVNQMEVLTMKNHRVGDNIIQIKDTIEKLSNEVTGIQGVVSMINDISDQTNLLALNASIEAARAGEAGRGFAVVADEVRKLAEQSKSSTKKIEEIIKKILGQTSNSVELVQTSVNLFEEQTESVKETQLSFDHIIQDTDDIFQAIQSMEKSIEKMNVTKEKVEKSISDMGAITEVTSAATEEVSATTEEQFAAAEELGSLSENLEMTMIDLEKVINRFKVN